MSNNARQQTYLRWHCALLATTAVLSLLDYCLLLNIDTFMVRFIPGYKSNESLVTPVVMFFFIAYFINYRGIIYGWQRIAPYVIYGTAIFFPLITVTTACRFFWALPAELELYYREEMCGLPSPSALCGPALAHMVFCAMIRTVPILLIVPLAFFSLLKINFLGVAKPYGTSA